MNIASRLKKHVRYFLTQVFAQQGVEIGIGERDVVAAVLGTYLEPALHLIRIAHFDTGGEQFLGALAERRRRV